MKSFFLVSTLLAALSLPSFSADRALVVGVNKYPSLKDAYGRSVDLQGCVNDATDMSQSLQKRGFLVTLLTNEKATKAGIVSALRNPGTGQGDRFVFYFAGHGTEGPNRAANLLPSDSSLDSSANDLSADELEKLVKAVPAASRTILLDSCHSGGMTRAFSKDAKPVRKTLKLRYFDREGARKTRSLETANIEGANSKDFVLKAARPSEVGSDMARKNASGITYFTAARFNELAAEDEFNGERHGVFTYYTLQELDGSLDQPRLWNDVQMSVSAKVSAFLDNQQNPTLSSAHADKPLFYKETGAPLPVTPAVIKPAEKNVWELYSADASDESKISLSISPDETQIPVGAEVRFEMKVGMDGYLVILERGTSGNLNILFPEGASLEGSRVVKGQEISIPEKGYVFSPDQPGTERLKAILFTDLDLASALLRVFKERRSIPLGEAIAEMKRDFVKVKLAPQTIKPFYTADVICEVVPATKK